MADTPFLDKAKLKRQLDVTDGQGHLDKDKLKAKFDASNFDLNAFIRGAQVALVGANRAMQNPAIFNNQHYKQAAIAVAVGVAIHIIVLIPSYGIRIMLWFVSWFISLDTVSWDDWITNGLDFIQKSVLQITCEFHPILCTSSTHGFMDSLRWVDTTYVRMHQHDDPSHLRPMYYPNLKQYPTRDSRTHNTRTADSFTQTLVRHARKAALGLAIYAASFLPVVGRFVLPALSFHTFRKAVGLGPATALFAIGLVLPRSWGVVFLQTYYGSRSLVRELLEPYFARLRFDARQKRKWFRAREGILFGFGLGFWVLVRVPLVGVLMYGIAEASAAYLVTKITDAPPLPRDAVGFAESQQEWRNKQKFLSLPMAKLDTFLDKAAE
ncbi:transmembrane protein UsgS [Ceratocystis lukuohia]|uniref:Transmembrane protein UsgS n=1 Tax=Ceratocystis lukuohia TaxID=2019550 RepID=A0ABR4MF30_9PEZI